jgi:hypothetical protein
MSSRNTQWDNLQQTGEGEWLMGQDNITAGMDKDLLTGLTVYAGALGDFTQWTNLDLL